MSKKRLKSDLRDLIKNKIDGISATPINDLFHWDGIIIGPPDSIYEGGIFKLKMTFTNEYPNIPPKVIFVTKLFHPNIYGDGSICLDILKKNWSPIYSVNSILLSIQSLLLTPNPQSPANIEAAKLFINNRRQYNSIVKTLINNI